MVPQHCADGSIRFVSRPRALFIDLDDTLLDLSSDHDALVYTCEELSAQAGIDAAQLRAANTEVWNTYWPTIESSWVLGLLEPLEIRQETWSRTLRVCGCTDASTLQLAVQVHADTERKLYRAFDDVDDLLSTAKSLGIGLAVVTNGNGAFQREKLRVLEIEDCFEAIVVSGELGIAKPDPWLFTTALQTFGLTPSEGWHVGDNPMTDVAGARAAGMSAIWLNRTARSRAEQEPESHAEIRSLHELATLLRQ